ncbi:MAG: hypothetical protein QG675_292 [Patescibacteria group bacterium]|jgi:hypothetical protein|nr:hypothetical protein [Patescibacteria group bacterium]
MTDKLLKIFLVNKVEASYLTNFFVLFTVLVVTQYRGFIDFFTSAKNVGDSIFLALLLFAVYLMVGIIDYLLLSDKHHEIARSMASYSLAVTLVVLLIISFVSIGDAPADEWTPQLVLVLFLAGRYLIKLLILIVYFVLGRMQAFNTRAYLAIVNRLTASIGRYRPTYQEVAFTAVIGVVAMIWAGSTEYNIYIQFLVIFTVMNLVSYVIQTVRGPYKASGHI